MKPQILPAIEKEQQHQIRRAKRNVRKHNLTYDNKNYIHKMLVRVLDLNAADLN